MKRHDGRKSFPSQPPRYIGPRRTDRLRQRDAAKSSGHNVSSDRVRVAVTDDELDTAFLAALADDCEDER